MFVILAAALGFLAGGFAGAAWAVVLCYATLIIALLVVA